MNSIEEGIIKIAFAKINSQQAKIDALMLEYCPDEMTEEQMKNWENAQTSVKLHLNN